MDASSPGDDEPDPRQGRWTLLVMVTVFANVLDVFSNAYSVATGEGDAGQVTGLVASSLLALLYLADR